jgi:hypothetical protein
LSASKNLFRVFDAGPEKFERVAQLFRCTACGHDVMRGGKFVAQLQDSITFIGCRCLTVSLWEFETPIPGPERWRKLIRLAKDRDVEMIVFGPNFKGGREYDQN